MFRRIFHPTSTSGILGLMAGIFGAVALILLLIAAGLAVRTTSFLHGAASATGTVVSLQGRSKCSSNSDHEQYCSTVYAPHVRFTTPDGREVDYYSTSATSPPVFHEGQRVEIRYDPDDPTRARIYSFTDLWLAPIIVGGIGVIFALVTGLLAFIGYRVRSSRSADIEEPVEPAATTEWQDPGTLR